MIAKNVGIRRAGGRLILATNIDIIFSTELIEHIASGRLQPGCLYRVDRHDIQSNFPDPASLEDQMEYCASHQLRLHTRSGSYPVDHGGRPVCLPDDVVDGNTVMLGKGWHVWERADAGRVYRWATDRAELIVHTGAVGGSEALLELEVESNPYDRSSWVELAAIEAGRTLGRARVAGRKRLQLPLTSHAGAEARQIELRVTDESGESRRRWPAFERRNEMAYRVFSGVLKPQALTFEYPPARWNRANESAGLTLEWAPEGLLVVSDPRKASYCVRYGPLRAAREGTYRLELTRTVLDGDISCGLLSGDDRSWIASQATVLEDMVSQSQRLEVTVDLKRDQLFWLVVANNHPSGDRVSRFLIRRLESSVDPNEMLVESVLGQVQPEARPPARWVGRLAALADRIAAVIASNLGERMRGRVVCKSPELRASQEAFHASQRQLQELVRVSQAQADELATLRDFRELSEFHRFLREHRPDDLHLNGCGDFQLMAREHWHDLRGYPEFEMFSMNIDGLLSYTAAAAGIREQMLPMPIYHLEHEVGSGWSPEGETVLRQRIDKRGITWLDATTAHVWASYMRWLQRPVIFNPSNWGLADVVLPETARNATAKVTQQHVRDRR
jgi:hypothetical protein